LFGDLAGDIQIDFRNQESCTFPGKKGADLPANASAATGYNRYFVFKAHRSVSSLCELYRSIDNTAKNVEGQSLKMNVEH
jgi:hypothetical protein